MHLHGAENLEAAQRPTLFIYLLQESPRHFILGS